MKSYNTMLAGLRDLITNPNPRVPVALCLDVSGSMYGQPMDELNAGVQQYLQEMQNDELASSSAETAVVTFGDEAVCHADFNTADKLQLEPLEAGGLTCMGEGLEMSLDLLEKRKGQYKSTGVDYYQPILVVMSDGAPNGKPALLREMTEKIQQLVEARRLTVISVGIGSAADMTVMQRLSPRQGAISMKGLRFREFFAWLSQSVSGVSNSAPGQEPELNTDALRALAAEPWPSELR